MFENVERIGKYLGQAARLMVGIPDYDAYIQHMKLNHPDKIPMSYKEFYRDRVDARYGANGNVRCC